MENKSRYINGVTRVRHKGVTVTTSLNSEGYERFIKDLQTKNVDIGYIPAGYENRPDLISDVFFPSPDSWWIIMEANNIDDPFENLAVHDRLVIPQV